MNEHVCMTRAVRRTVCLACAASCAMAFAAVTAPDSIAPPAPAAATTPGATPGPKLDGRCDHCGGCDRVGKMAVKRLAEKEITKICWGYRCEEVCIPGPSIFCGAHQHHDACGCWTCRLWKPTSAEVITRRVPEKKEVTRKVPAVVWTVEERCPRCRHVPAAIDSTHAGVIPSAAAGREQQAERPR